jgi:oligoendopeptidase F
MTQEQTSYALTWDLESIFPGGSSSPTLHAALHHTKHRLLYLQKKLKQVSDLKKCLLQLQDLYSACQELDSFITCLLSQNVADQQALQLHSQIVQLKASCETLGVELDASLALLDDMTFNRLLSDPDIQSIAFPLQERRRRYKEKLPPDQEKLIHQLSIDGYHGWHNAYTQFIGQLRLVSPLNSTLSLSVGQAENYLSHPDRHVRQAWFQRWEETWTTHEDLAAQFLNHLAGFRLNLYTARRCPSILQEPLADNHMQKQTLDMMWHTIEERRGCLQDYMACKARLMGIERLAWYDVEAALPLTSQPLIPFDEAARLIIQQFSFFSPAMGYFAKEAFENRWIEAEDRSGKRPSGFCASLPRIKQSRIFMTYNGTMTNLFTLAHELGHAYHNYEVRDLPVFAQHYPMNLAETASTLAEMIVIDSLIQQRTQDPNIKLFLLDYKLQRSVLFLMNIHARFLFELDFYEERRKGFVSARELSSLMEQAQQRAFGAALAEWHPHFWMAKQHFYFTDLPFYNFPYTFGYLFSLGIYAHLRHHRRAEEVYASLLRDTGNQTAEDLAERYLGAKLGEPFFWQEALRLIQNDVALYLELAKGQA